MRRRLYHLRELIGGEWTGWLARHVAVFLRALRLEKVEAVKDRIHMRRCQDTCRTVDSSRDLSRGEIWLGRRPHRPRRRSIGEPSISRHSASTQNASALRSSAL